MASWAEWLMHASAVASKAKNTSGASDRLPCIAVYSSLFPCDSQPNTGLFIRERMFRLRDRAPLVVVAPQPWFPFQSLLRWLRPGYRPDTPRREVQEGVTVHFPRFFAFPGALRSLDGLSMALCTAATISRLRRELGVGIIDAHFAYPCGYAATLLGRWLRLPVSITLRGTETRHLQTPGLRDLAVRAVRDATQVLSVSDSLRQLFVKAGVDGTRIRVIGNGVDLTKFRRLSRKAARSELGILEDAQVLISVGGLVERKGFHRVIEVLPNLLLRFPRLRYLVVGGPSAEGDMGTALRAQVDRLGLQSNVIFTGPLPPERLSVPLSAADVFVLATANEGWANVFLEAMACGLPIVTTDVGGNREVVNAPQLGRIVRFGDSLALQDALAAALAEPWDRERIVAYAQENSWDRRIALLDDAFRTTMQRATARAG
jgi:teichuronic acid biosynthesis glycosyltransferase TuaC